MAHTVLNIGRSGRKSGVHSRCQWLRSSLIIEASEMQTKYLAILYCVQLYLLFISSLYFF